MNDKCIVTVEKDPNTGELILPIPDSLLVEMEWVEGDSLVWEECIMCEDDGEYSGYTLRRYVK
jgi:hypothetical protein